jgi:hypothetical protein
MAIGVGVFDQITQAQKQATILVVAQALLDPNAKPPKVNAVCAGTVDAIYRELRGCIEIEIDTSNESIIRAMVLEALEEMRYWDYEETDLEPGEEPFMPPNPKCTDYGEWSPLVDALWDEVLEDCDFDMEEGFLDMPPAEAEVLKKKMNISPDYFRTIASDPTKDQLLKIRGQLRNLLAGPSPWRCRSR